ncbi:MAG: hypothetical protein JWM20_320 [Patescibacteria group bacterium]|nr:hypothetical protein [Patescibacteria group bacterium]
MDKEILLKQVIDALDLPHCSIIKNGVIIEKPGNSIVHALIPSPELEKIMKKLIPSFSKFFKKNLKRSDFRFGINYVRVEGPLEEEMHVHISCIIAMVVFGKGIAIYEKDGQELREPVEEGDIVIVPQNAPHYFISEEVVIYAGIEFGPVIDYQKHHKH